MTRLRFEPARPERYEPGVCTMPDYGTDGARLTFGRTEQLQWAAYIDCWPTGRAAGHEPWSPGYHAGHTARSPAVQRPVGRARSRAGATTDRGTDGRGAVTGQGGVVRRVNVTLVLSYCMTLQLPPPLYCLPVSSN